MSEQLEEIRQFCSNWICKHLGKEYDLTPWWDKWQLYSAYVKIGAYEKQQTMNFADIIKEKNNEIYRSSYST